MTNTESYRPTWAEINLDNLAFNLHSIKHFIGEGVKMMAVVKANAYGHDAVECAKRLETEGVDWFGVAIVEEAIELRNAGIETPILSLGSFWLGQERALISYGITPVLFDLEKAALLDRVAGEKEKIVDVHIKIDTGMGRVGILFRDIGIWAERFSEFKNLRLEGLMTHFAAADDLNDDFTDLQMQRFADAVAIFHEKGFRPTILDMANSPGAVAHSDSRATMVRIGGILYGLGDDVLPKGIERPELLPVMSLHSRVAFLKQVPAGETIGYGRTFTTTRNSVIVTLSIGYHDGYRRAISNKGRIIINGSYAPVVGRVSMDWITVDVTDVPNVQISDEAVLIGSQGGLRITAEEIAAITGTISYEITCGINPRVGKVFRSNQ